MFYRRKLQLPILLTLLILVNSLSTKASPLILEPKWVIGASDYWISGGGVWCPDDSCLVVPIDTNNESRAGRLEFINTNSGITTKVVNLTEPLFPELSFSPAGKFLIASDFGEKLIVFDSQTLEIVVEFDEVSHPVFPLWSHDDKLLFVRSYNKAIRSIDHTEIWDIDKKTIVYTSNLNTFPSLSNDYIVENYEKFLKFKNIKNQSLIGMISLDSTIYSIDWSPTDATQMLISTEDDIQLWDVLNFQLIAKIAPYERVPLYVSDGQEVIYKQGNDWMLWNIDTQNTIRGFTANIDNPVFFLQQSPLHDYALASYDSYENCTTNCYGGSLIWDWSNAELLQNVTFGSVYPDSQWQPNSIYVLSKKDESTLVIWDAKTGTKVFELQHNSEFIQSYQFNQDGSKLVVYTNNHIYLWDFS